MKLLSVWRTVALQSQITVQYIYIYIYIYIYSVYVIHGQINHLNYLRLQIFCYCRNFCNVQLYDV